MLCSGGSFQSYSAVGRLYTSSSLAVWHTFVAAWGVLGFGFAFFFFFGFLPFGLFLVLLFVSVYLGVFFLACEFVFVVLFFRVGFLFAFWVLSA